MMMEVILPYIVNPFPKASDPPRRNSGHCHVDHIEVQHSKDQKGGAQRLHRIVRCPLPQDGQPRQGEAYEGTPCIAQEYGG